MKTIEVFESKEEAFKAASNFAENDEEANYIEGEVDVEYHYDQGLVAIVDAETSAVYTSYTLFEIKRGTEIIGYVILSTGEDSTVLALSETAFCEFL